MFKNLFLHLIMLLPSHCSNQVFQEQPGCSEKILLHPVGTEVQLRCSVMEGYRIEWAVTLPEQTEELSSDLPELLVTLRARGIVVESPDNETSLLIINATESTNGTAATCVAINRNNPLARVESRQVQLLYYGPPSTPTDLTAIENGVGSFRISWSSSLPMARVFYILIALNVNTSIPRPIIVTGTEPLVFTVDNSSSCDVYTFQVTALNAAGSSGPSEILTRSLPSLPDISAIEDSLEQSLDMTADGVTLSVMFQEITSCPEYPVTNYTLVLVDSEGNETRESSVVTSGEISLVIDGLMEDSLYSYYIVATNMIGDSMSTMLNKTSTDVQGVSICLVEDITYSIQCSYITGSDARGCVYTLVSGMEGEANITGTVDRNSSEGVQVDLLNVGDQLLVFDWERNNSTGTIPVRINLTQAELCENEEYTSSSEITDFSTSTINFTDPSDTDSSITEDTSVPRGTACVCDDTTIPLAVAAAGIVFIIIILCVIIIIIITTVIICLRKYHRNHVSPSIFISDIPSQDRQLNDIFNLSSPFKNEMGKGANDAEDFEGLYNIIDSAHVGSSAIYDEVGGATVETTSLLENRVEQVNNQHTEPPAKDEKNQTHQDNYSHLHHGAEISIAPKNSNKHEVVDTTGTPEVPKKSAKSVKDAEYAVLDTTGAPEVPKRSVKSVKEAEYAVLDTMGASEVPKKSAKSVKDAEYAVLDTMGVPEVPKRSAKSVKDAEYAVVGTTGAPEVPKRSKALEEYVKDQYQEECKD